MGGDPTDGSFEGLNVWEYFNSDCYDDFDDSEEGFYTVYRKVFDTLAAEEEKFDEDHKTKAADIPSFGKKNSDAKEVNAFYNFWLRFSSQKSFSWKDVYRTSDVCLNPNLTNRSRLMHAQRFTNRFPVLFVSRLPIVKCAELSKRRTRRSVIRLARHSTIWCVYVK